MFTISLPTQRTFSFIHSQTTKCYVILRSKRKNEKKVHKENINLYTIRTFIYNEKEMQNIICSI
jgi:hypothetical protein